MRRSLAFVFTVVALSVPIAGMFLMMWPLLPQHASFAIDGVEVIGSAIASGAAGIALASYIYRDRGTRL